MSSTMKSLRIVFYILCGCSGVAIAYWLAGPLLRSPEEPQQVELTELPSGPKVVGLETVGSVWNWEKAEAAQAEAAADGVETSAGISTFEFHVPTIHEQLKKIRLTEDGSVRLDDTARSALEEALSDGDLILNRADMERLKSIIRSALPDRVGRETAQIVEDYYEYLEAKDRYRTQNPTDQDTDPMEDYEALVSLRGMTLGWDVADQLFYKADNDARYMIESFELARNAELTPEERAAQQAELAEKYYQTRPPISGWDQRLSQFAQERGRMAGSEEALSPQQRTELEQWVQSEFSADERATMADYGISLVEDDVDELLRLSQEGLQIDFEDEEEAPESDENVGLR